jgi:C-terminal processing protease CtpA/Prc
MRQLTLIGFAVVCWVGFAGNALAQGSLDKLEKRLAESAEQQSRKRLPPPANDEKGYLGLSADDRDEGGKGVRIVSVVPGGPAAQAGLKANDLVTSVDNRSITSMDEFAAVVGKSHAGGLLVFEVQRDAERYRYKVTLARRPAATERPDVVPGFSPPPDAEPPMGLLGVVVEEVTSDVQRELKLAAARGAVVVGLAPGGAAQEAGVPLDAVILAVDDEPIDAPDDLGRLVASAGPGAEVTLSYSHRGKLHERTLRLAKPNPALPPLLTAPVEEEPVTPGEDEAPAQERIMRLEQRVFELEARLAALERLLLSAEPAPRARRLPTNDP